MLDPDDGYPPRAADNPMWNKIVQVNVAVNKAIKPMNDFDIYGKDEVWAYPDQGGGDCEDYVLLKRRKLSQPASRCPTS